MSFTCTQYGHDDIPVLPIELMLNLFSPYRLGIFSDILS